MIKKRLFLPAAYFLLTSVIPCQVLAGDNDMQEAAELYHDYCSVCHGDRGDGNSRAKQGLVTPPRDFTLPGLSRVLSREEMIDVVLHGRPGTAMVGWSTRLSREQAEKIVDYIRDNFMDPLPDRAGVENREAGADHQAAMKQGFTQGLTGNAEKGKRFYEENCATCHGIKGNGDGPRAYFIFPKPRNFLSESARKRLNRVVLFNAIKYGIRGKEMPAWGKVLSDQQIANVAEYVFTAMIRPDSSPGE